MNTRKLIGLTLTAVVIISSTFVINFEGKNTEKATKNVVKVASSNLSENSNSNVDELKTSDKKAIDLAKNYLKKYMNVDMDEKMKQDHLRADVGRDKDASKVVYVFFDPIDAEKSYETFNKTNTIYDDYNVMIYLKDGKVASIRALDGIKSTKGLKCDKEKAKAATEKFLKDKGIFDGIASIDLIGDSDAGKEYGRVMMNCKDATGNEIFYVEVDLNTYSVVGFDEIKEGKSEGLMPNK
ncbi:MULTISPECIES: hypothetical protein [Clostridium]|uniref:hypothetical protein n=1 Tax=Clostridium TaxID=1485 RepID=UPI0008264D9D|nr:MULTISPECIES: hypothetical protein [Clostridium]PJI07896.1 hypothetical protein CUB90_08465 [Clostridium sp. CT7]